MSPASPNIARVRVRYPEVDPQGVVHHAVYLHYFEFGRTEMLRELGLPYSQLERDGLRLMVTQADLRFVASAHYDDVLVITTRVERISKVRLYMSYSIAREETGVVVCEGQTVLASIAESGRPARLPRRLIEAFRSLPSSGD